MFNICVQPHYCYGPYLDHPTFKFLMMRRTNLVISSVVSLGHD